MHRHFGFPIATLQLFQHPENVKFQFLALHSPGRNAISPEVFNEFSKTFFSLKEEEAGYCGWKFQVHRHFHFPIATLQLFQHPKNVKISIFPLHCPGRNAISPEVFNEFSKTFFSLKEEKADYCHWKFQVHRHFRFPKATLQLFQHPKNVKISIFPFTLSWQKCYISRSI